VIKNNETQRLADEAKALLKEENEDRISLKKDA